MKRVWAVALAALLLCGAVSFTASAADQPTFRQNYYKVRYLSTTQLTYNNEGSLPVRFECEENSLGISVDENSGLVTSSFCLRKWGFVEMKIYSGDELCDTCTVEVDADMWQWMIIIFLLGWSWY